MDELEKRLNQVTHALDQSAAENRDAGELKKAEADKKLAQSFGVAAERLGNLFKRIEKRIERQKMLAIDFHKYQKGMKDESPNFNMLLFQLLRKADTDNFEILRRGYPLEAKMIELWDTGSYPDTLEGSQQIENDARKELVKREQP